MGFTPDFLEELRSRLPISDVVGKRVKLIRKGREYSGLCPFHNEKTPSFTVNDDKAFYHCFGCGAHGDVIRFVTETEGLSFPEAVERLAAQAGLAVPEYRSEDREKSVRRKTLYDVMESAAQWYESQLKAQIGREGREYLRRRGLTPETVQRFRLGYAPDSRTALKEALLARDGISEDLLVEGGLLIRPEAGDNRETYDRFRHRIMFPITDRQGRVVAFGGRALHREARAKYLNSPETPLFHKGRLLYNMASARKSAHEQGRLLVAEGYMDVIALAQAGFEYAVAPLGTAVTEDQITELWRMAAEPVMCFDGDQAGFRAAHRVVERALPLLKPGYSLRFLYLPEGEDPDSYIQGHGARAFRDLLEGSEPLANVLWGLLTRKAPVETPEQRAGLQHNIHRMLSEIRHDTIRGYYENDFRQRLKAHLGQDHLPAESDVAKEEQGGAWENRGAYSRPLAVRSRKKRPWEEQEQTISLTKTSLAQGHISPSLMRERLIILTVLNHPWLLKDHHEEFAVFDFESEELDKLRNEIIGISIRDSDLDRESLHRHLEKSGYGRALEVIFEQGVLKGDWFAWPDAAPEDVVQGWMHVVNRQRLFILEKEKMLAQQQLAENMTEENFTRLQAIKAEIEAVKAMEASMEGYGLASGRRKPS